MAAGRKDMFADANAGYVFDDESDGDYAESDSDDAADAPRAARYGPAACVCNMGRPPPVKASTEDFEDEMEQELVGRFNAARTDMSQSAPPAAAAAGAPPVQDEHYDNMYFDSEDEEESGAPKGERRKMTNDELLYDPEMDNDDEAWVARHRHHHGMTEETDQTRAAAQNAAKGLQPTPQSDAILNCPACMSVVCLDCQQYVVARVCSTHVRRHDVYTHQFRAMFVMNCIIKHGESLLARPPKEKKRKGKKGAAQDGAAAPAPEWDGAAGDVVHPVACGVCNTIVAVYDSEEVYHFFNVLASEA